MFMDGTYSGVHIYGRVWGRKDKMPTYNLTVLTPICRMRVRKADEGILFYEHLNQNIRNYSSSWAMWKKLENRIRSCCF